MRLRRLALLFVIFAARTIAQDVQVKSAGFYVELGRNISWSNMNRTFLISPQNPDQSVCLFVVNNNPTNAHSFALAVSQTGDQSVADFSNNSGRWVSGAVVGLPSSVPASSTVTAYMHANAAAKIAFNFSGASTQAGSPDTADIFAVQTSAQSCGAVNPTIGQQYTLSTPNTGTSSSLPIQSVSDGISQAFQASGGISSSGTNTVLLNLNANSGSRSIYFDRLFISATTAAASVTINFTSTTGSGCSLNTPINLKLGSSVTSSALSNVSCTGFPTNLSGFFIVTIAPNTDYVVDLRGIIAPNGTTTGLDVIGANATGATNVTLTWYEK